MDTKALRQKILDLAIRGKLVPQDPNDEPASVLLERIRAEKQQMVKDGKLKPKDIKNDTVIFKDDDNLHYEKFSDGIVKCIEDEIPFDVPNNWEWVRIKTACVINPRNSIDDNTEVSFVPMANIKEGYANKFISDIRVWKKVKKGYTHFANNDIGIAKITPCFENKKSVVFSSLINGYGAGTTELYILRAISSLVIPEYLLNFVKRDDFIAGGVLTFSGDVGQQRVTKDYVANYLFTLPPLNEQQRILNAVHTATSLIESIEKANDNLIRDIDKTKAKILDLAIRGKLVPQDSNDEPASVLLERIRAEKEELIKQGKIKRDKKESVIFKGDDNSYYEKIGNDITCIDDEIPFETPINWQWVRLGSTVGIERGGSPRPIKSYITTDSNGINWIKIGDVDKDGKYITNTKEKIKPTGIKKSREVYPGDFLLTNSMSFGRPYISKIYGCVHDGWLVLRNPDVVFDINFLYYLLSSNYLYNQFVIKASGSTVDNLNIDKVSSALICLPPLKEQTMIVHQIEKLMKLIQQFEELL